MGFIIRCGGLVENWEMGKRKKRSRDVAAEGVGLIGPIEAMGASGVVGEAMFGLGVVFEYL